MKKLIKLSFDLKQTVGMIHFQGQENGATIRATDLKPKLDRFLARYIAADRKLNWATDSCVQEEEENMLEALKTYMIEEDEKGNCDIGKWFIDYTMNHYALNYKVRIYANPNDFVDPHLFNERKGTYYGAAQFALSEKSEEGLGVHKVGVKYKKIRIEMVCYDVDFANYLLFAFQVFMSVTNFGYLSGKGYGSFVIDNIETMGLNITTKKLSFKEALKKYKSVMDYNNGNSLLICCLTNGTNANPPRIIDETYWLDRINEFNHYLKCGKNMPRNKKNPDSKSIYFPSPLLKGYFKKNGKQVLVNEKRAMKHNAVEAGIELKVEEENVEIDVEHLRIDKDARIIYAKGLFGLAMEYQFLLKKPGNKLSYIVGAFCDEEVTVSRFPNPIRYRIEHNTVYMLIDLKAVKMLQELNVKVEFNPNMEQVKPVLAYIPTADEFVMEDYFRDEIINQEHLGNALKVTEYKEA